MVKFFLLILMCGGLMACSTQSDDVSVNSQEAAMLNTQLGLAYLKAGDSMHAKEKLLLALSQDPKLPEAQLAMGYYLQSVGDSTHAKTYYQKALQLAPYSSRVKNDYGAFLCQTGDYTKAHQYLSEAAQDIHYLNQSMAVDNLKTCEKISSALKEI
ncbi:MAG: hypothetical protein A2103_00560 [Gammaproteobacteria bacterium GWF2_41_13]|nr:MAG: hypothetical protein A2103_00560 [Gammaproteobacteria bacterium GWF2_41_13]